MAETWHINIRHWINEKEEPGVPRLKSKVEFLKKVIAYETSKGASFAQGPPICWRRPNRKPCTGKIETALVSPVSAAPDETHIQWDCPICGDKGYLSGWNDLKCDLFDQAIDDIERFQETISPDKSYLH